MKKIITLAALGLLIAAPMSAQTVYDAAKITNKDLNGTGCMARTPKVFCTVIAVMAVAA